jgi:prepilin-type N-terminal cleavage/methylation domain-containing protein
LLRPTGWKPVPRAKKPGFSLVELLAAIAILGVLFDARSPAFGR